MPDEQTASRFAIVLDGSEVASFTQLQGITSELHMIDVIEYMESSDKEVILSDLPSTPKRPTVTLSRGRVNSSTISDWHEAARLGDFFAARKSCSLVMYGPAGDPVARYHLEQAWPANIELQALQAGTSQILMERVIIRCESMQRLSV